MAITRIGNPAIADQRGVNFRNIIINGGMDVAQRGTTITSPVAGAFLLDRFKYNENFGATCTITQSSDVPSSVGFINSMKIDITTSATPTAAEEFKIDYNVEGQHFGYIGYGTSAAKSLTLSFWVKSNVTGTYRVNFLNLNGTGNRIIGGTYTINSSSTWEKKTITIPGDTAQATYLTNAAGFRVEFYLASGPDRTSGSLPTSWIAYDATRRASGQGVNLASSTSNEWYITGVQLEAGQVASDFEFLPYDVNLQRCRRYYQKYGEVAYTGITTGYQHSTTHAAGGFPLGVKMRSAPSISATTLIWTDRVNFDSDATLTGSVSSASSIYLRASFSSSGAAYRGGLFAVKNGTTGFLELNSEL